MADQASSSIVIDADKSAVMAVIADFESYPEWASMIRNVTVDERGADGRGTAVSFNIDPTDVASRCRSCSTPVC